jgi:hypothetical protein
MVANHIRPSGVRAILACDEPVPGLTEKLAELFPGRPINDLTEPGLLARLLYRN